MAPIDTIGGSLTGLSGIAQIALDASQQLYVANGTTNSVTVYAAGASGNVAPIHTIAGPLTQLSVPSGIALDAAGDIYVSNCTTSITEAPQSSRLGCF